MDYRNSRKYITESEQYNGSLSLENISNLMHYLNDPQDQLKFIHVAGTNGKGSVIAYLYTTLNNAGYKVGRYISPSVYHYREKMEVCGKCISKEEFAYFTTITANAVSEMVRDGLPHPTPFEIETAVAFLFFKEKKCDLVVLETGMGGKDDATNVIRNTLLAVLTPISLEHQAWLGNTLSEIAEKKAGIIKPGCLVVSSAQDEEAKAVIQKKTDEEKSSVIFASPSEINIIDEDIYGQRFVYRNKIFEINLSGVYQTSNALTALKALETLDSLGFSTTTEQKYNGLKSTRWDGRLTVINKKPLFLIDGAHNPAAAIALEESVNKYLKGKRLIFIMAIFADKDYQTLINRMCPYADVIIATETPDNPRALPAEKLKEAIMTVNTHVKALPTIAQAVEEAFSQADDNDAILAFGTLSFLGEISNVVMNRQKEESLEVNFQIYHY